MAKIPETEKQQKLKRIYREVQSYEGIRTTELAEKLDIPERTLREYLTEMEGQGMIMRDGWELYTLELRERKLRPIEFDPVEGMMLLIALRAFTKSQDRRNFRSENMMVTIAQAMIEDIGMEQCIYGLADDLAKRDEDTVFSQNLEMILSAFINHQQIELHYQPYNERAYTTVIEPYFFEPSPIGMTTYVYAWDVKVSAMRQFKLERILKAEKLRSTYEIPEDFDALSYMQDAASSIGGYELENVELRFAPRVRQRVYENQWFRQSALSDLENGGVSMRLRVANLLDLKPWIRSWGADCEVVSPKHLRDEMMGEARALAKLYGIQDDNKNDIDYNRFDDMFGD